MYIISDDTYHLDQSRMVRIIISSQTPVCPVHGQSMLSQIVCTYAEKIHLSCQFTAYLTDELWLKNATHANVMAAKLYKELKKLPEVTFTQKVESNQLFLTMPRPIIDRMLESYFFYFWNEDKDEIRLVTSFDTTEEDVDEFIRLLKR